MGVEIDDNEQFDSLLADKRHKELAGALKGIASILSQKKDDGIASAIEKQSKNIELFIEAIKSNPTEEKKEVKIELNNEEIISSVSEMADSITKGFLELKQSLNNKSKEWYFRVHRNTTGFIESVTATQQK